MEQTHYLREAKPILRKLAKDLTKENLQTGKYINTLLNTAERAEKFILPDGGIILDSGLKGLNGICPKLPYKEVVIEYKLFGSLTEQEISLGMVHSDKRIVIAKDFDTFIALNVLYKQDQLWYPCAYQALIPIEPIFLDGSKILSQIKIAYNEELLSPEKRTYEYAALNINGEICALLSLLEVLSCSNVTSERLPRQKLNGSVKDCLPYDEYRVLVINVNKKDSKDHLVTGAEQASKREHLRRGHIRTYQDGKKVWVQQCIVNAGANGKIVKDYLIAA